MSLCQFLCYASNFDRVCACVPLVEIDIGLLADQVGVSLADTLDLGQGVHDLLLACCQL